MLVALCVGLALGDGAGVVARSIASYVDALAVRAPAPPAPPGGITWFPSSPAPITISGASGTAYIYSTSTWTMER